MATSPSNSGVLRNVGDTVTLERDPNHDGVGVQVYGDGDGVELLFEGAILGGALLPLSADPMGDTILPTCDGRYAYIVRAPQCSHVQVRLAAISGGSVTVALYSGSGDGMKAIVAAVPKTGEKPAPAKMKKAVPAKPSALYRLHETAGNWYVIDNVTGRSSDPFKTKVDAERWLVAQAQTPSQDASAWPYKVKENAGQFFVFDAQNRAGQPFKTREEANAWIAAQPKP